MKIAIDGPAGSGKSTISKIIADKRKIVYIDTGAMYRAVTLFALENGVEISDDVKLQAFMPEIKIDFDGKNILLNGKVVNEEIRTREVTGNVSEVSAKRYVRERLVELQREMAAGKDVIMDGRDIGTVVLKDAEFKIFLNASIEERAARRHKELLEKGSDLTFEAICTDIKRRDEYDSTRKESPLRKADDAIEIDTTGLSIGEVVEKIESLVWRVS